MSFLDLLVEDIPTAVPSLPKTRYRTHIKSPNCTGHNTYIYNTGGPGTKLRLAQNLRCP